MIIFFSVILYFLIVALSVFLIIKLRELSAVIKAQTEAANKLDKELYTNLRELQYKAKDITKQANKYICGKNSILGEIVSSATLAVLPFKKLKSLIYLHKLGKKVMR